MITSGNDGRHKKGSRRYADGAIEIRGNHLPDEHCQRITDSLQESLGPDFDVIFEKFPKDPRNDHIHMAHDPKPRAPAASRSNAEPTDELAIGDWMQRRNRHAGWG